jgi:UDP-2,3-diacylglucosamine pyrophosphatase LpxH
MSMLEQAYVISDLHIGCGDVDPNLEDFYQDIEFVRFVDSIAAPDTALFINGDFIDFVQIPPYDVPRPNHLLWHEDASVEKLEHALKAHPTCFEALGRFLSAGARLRILIGNHDLDLVWPKTQARLRGLLGNPSSDALRFSVDFENYHGVVIEHGHSCTPENCPSDARHFVHTWTDASGRSRDYLERVWGTDFMLSFYNNLERTYAFADNVKPMASVMFHGLRAGWIGGRELVRLVVFLKRRGVPWRGLVSSILDDVAQPVVQDVLVGIAEDAWRGAVIQRVTDDPEFVTEVEHALAELPAEDRELVASTEPGAIQLDEPDLAPEQGSAVLGLFRDAREDRAARSRLKMDGITAVVYGHTHVIVDGGVQGCLYNPGTWIPHLDLQNPAVREKIKQHGLSLDMLNDKRLYVTERRSVHLVPDGNHRTKTKLLEI